MTTKICPICFIKKLFRRPSKITSQISAEPYNNGVADTPPMGWSSWNTFRNNINEDVIYQTALAAKESGLAQAGYEYINIDDCWQSSLRDSSGNLQGDLATFPSGIAELISKINALGLKVGIYSSNGTHTCEDLPSSLDREEQDAKTFANWGAEYFKYDFCHNITIPNRAPYVYAITINKKGKKEAEVYPVTQAELLGCAKLKTDKSGITFAKGLGKNKGAIKFSAIEAQESGTYIFTLNIIKQGKYDKYIAVRVNDEESGIAVPPQKLWNHTARFQLEIELKQGSNTILLYNPIATVADSARLQYTNMGKILTRAVKTVAQEKGIAPKPMIYSICEWGKNKPWQWGRFAGNLWRTTYDIRPFWHWIVIIYNKNVKLYKYSQKGGYNDPDMLEVGNGKLSREENIAHFSLWCMMNAPLILGNDLRAMPLEVKEIVTNKNLININQDPLCKPCKRVVKGRIDVLAKPLSDNSIALCLFNKSRKSKTFAYDVTKLANDEYINLAIADAYTATDLWTSETLDIVSTLTAYIPPHGVRVYKIKQA